MSQGALETFSITRHTPDPRADGGTRVVRVTAERVVIERVLEKVRMKVAVPVSAYRNLVLSVRLHSETATLHLRHEDEDLDVALDAGKAMDVAARAKAWGILLGKPVSLEEACIIVNRPFYRQRKRTKPSRRSSFSRRRGCGIASRLDKSFLGEREIIART